MKSPEFRKQTGFIRRKSTNSDRSDEQEELSAYRGYNWPVYEARKYVYPSLSKQQLVGSPDDYSSSKHQHNQEEDSSDFDQFQMNESLSSQFKKPSLKMPKPEDSSFSLSPYEQSSEEQSAMKYNKWQPQTRNPYQFKKYPIPEESSQQLNYKATKPTSKHPKPVEQKNRQSNKWETIKHKGSEYSSHSDEDSEFVEKRDSGVHYKFDKPTKMEKHPPQSRLKGSFKNTHKQPSPKKMEQSSSSSSFSFDSSDSPQKKHYAQQRISRSPPKNRVHFRDQKVQNNDKTATFNKIEEITSKGQERKRTTPPPPPPPMQQSSGEDQQLIVEYDTKQFKGGSIKDRILNQQFVKQRQKKQSQKLNSYHQQNSSQIRSKYTTKRSQSPILKNDSKSSKPQLIVQQDHQFRHPSHPHHHLLEDSESKKAQKFQLDVKVKNMSLAQAFQLRCGRLKRRLSEEREQFKKGNYAKIYKQMQEENQAELANLEKAEVHRSHQRLVNKNMERMALGIKPQVNKRQMLRNTKKKYKQLPEVKHRMNEQRKKQDLARRMLNVKKLDREVRLRLKYANRR